MDSDNNEDTIGKFLYGYIPGIKQHPITGYYLSTYVGYADKEHRSSGSSGGIATWLLEKLLEDKIVDHIICVTPFNGPEKLFSYKIFDSPEEAHTGAGSVYYPVEMSDVMRHILRAPGRYAIVGLPCFIKAIRLAQIKNKKLNERVVVAIGLVCGQMKNRYFTDYIAALANVQGKILSVKYRVKSPDLPTINYHYVFKDDKGEDKKIFWVDGISEAWLNRWFTPKACNYCDDIFAECADIVCMDAWLPEYTKESSGTSILLIRSPVIAQMIQHGISSKKIFLNAIPIEKVIQSQTGVVEVKRQHLAYRLYRDQQIGLITPKKRILPIKPKNPFLRQEIILKEQMQVLCRSLWSSGKRDLNYFKRKMRPYLIRLYIGDKLLKFLRLIKIIK